MRMAKNSGPEHIPSDDDIDFYMRPSDARQPQSQPDVGLALATDRVAYTDPDLFQPASPQGPKAELGSMDDLVDSDVVLPPKQGIADTRIPGFEHTATQHAREATAAAANAISTDSGPITNPGIKPKSLRPSVVSQEVTQMKKTPEQKLLEEQSRVVQQLGGKYPKLKVLFPSFFDGTASFNNDDSDDAHDWQSLKAENAAGLGREKNVRAIIESVMERKFGEKPISERIRQIWNGLFGRDTA